MDRRSDEGSSSIQDNKSYNYYLLLYCCVLPSYLLEFWETSWLISIQSHEYDDLLLFKYIKLLEDSQPTTPEDILMRNMRQLILKLFSASPIGACSVGINGITSIKLNLIL